MSREQTFLEFYHEHRFKDQWHYYVRMGKEYEAAQQQASLFVAALMILAAVASAGAAAGAQPKAWWAVFATALPAIAGLGLAMQRLYAYERLAKLYGDAVAALAGIKSEPPIPGATNEQISAFVARVERILTREQGQWGQITEELKLPGEVPDPHE
jgi:hypothetical protein